MAWVTYRFGGTNASYYKHSDSRERCAGREILQIAVLRLGGFSDCGTVGNAKEPLPTIHGAELQHPMLRLIERDREHLWLDDPVRRNDLQKVCPGSVSTISKCRNISEWYNQGPNDRCGLEILAGNFATMHELGGRAMTNTPGGTRGLLVLNISSRIS